MDFIINAGRTIGEIFISGLMVLGIVASPAPVEQPPVVEEPPIVGAAISGAPALYDGFLSSGISKTATSMTISPGTLRNGQSLSGYFCFTIDNNAPTVEYVCGTASGTSVTGLERGVDVLNPNATSTSLAFSHRRFATVSISNYPTLQQIVRRINGTDEWEAALTFQQILSYDGAESFTPGSNQLITALYADSIANQGAATSSESASGISQLGTATEQASTTDNGANDPLVLQTKYASSTPTYGCDGSATAGALCNVIAKNDGKVHQDYLDIFATANSWAEEQTFNGAIIGSSTPLTDGATIDVDWTLANTHEVVLGGNRSITFSNVATGTAQTLFLCQDGTGSRTISSWPSEMRWQFGSAPTLTTTADKCDIISLRTSTSTNTVFGGIAPNF